MTSYLHHRLMRGLTQAQVASTVRMSRAGLSLIETGKREPSLKNALRLAGFYGISIEALMGLSQCDQCRRPCDSTTRSATGWELCIDCAEEEEIRERRAAGVPQCAVCGRASASLTPYGTGEGLCDDCSVYTQEPEKE